MKSQEALQPKSIEEILLAEQDAIEESIEQYCIETNLSDGQIEETILTSTHNFPDIGLHLIRKQIL